MVLGEDQVLFLFRNSHRNEWHTPCDLTARNSGNLRGNDSSCVSIYCAPIEANCGWRADERSKNGARTGGIMKSRRGKAVLASFCPCLWLFWTEKWPLRGSGVQLLPCTRGTPTAHSITPLLTFTASVAYCDKHAIDVISVIPRFYNRVGLIVIILWLTVWNLRVVVWSPVWFSFNSKTFGVQMGRYPCKFPFCVAALCLFSSLASSLSGPEIHQQAKVSTYKEYYCWVKV